MGYCSAAGLLGHGCCDRVFIGKVQLLQGQLGAFCSRDELKALGKVQQSLCLFEVLSAWTQRSLSVQL